jgi:hypothetical protein
MSDPLSNLNKAVGIAAIVLGLLVWLRDQTGKALMGVALSAAALGVAL